MEMPEQPLTQIKQTRWGTLSLVILAHVLVLIGLARAFAPDFTQGAVEQVTSIFAVDITAPPEPPPEQTQDAGASGEAGDRARPKPKAAPPARIPVKRDQPMPPAASDGKEDRSGAAAGAGTGGSMAGGSPGSGTGGDGQGNGWRKLEKTAGDINSAKDYPKKTRKLRLGTSVTVRLTVGTDGRVSQCRVTVPSPDAEADQITCRLASERFRFRPATDGSGNPRVATYDWRQRWFTNPAITED